MWTVSLNFDRRPFGRRGLPGRPIAYHEGAERTKHGGIIPGAARTVQILRDVVVSRSDKSSPILHGLSAHTSNNFIHL
jgi:hypothetical protein